MNQQKVFIIAFCFLVAGFVGGMFYGKGLGYSNGYAVGDSAGYDRAGKDSLALQKQAEERALTAAAEEANPFQSKNPLAGVEADPLAKAKGILNPFK